jgi:hypothetical protein
MSYQTNTNTTVAANEVFGAIKEKAQLAGTLELARDASHRPTALYFTDIEKSVVKATNRDICVPKSKHVVSE